ncbi:hypothetical protein B0T18DRAFT_344130 [Schizothecium vesticola]|uniref:Uncharacterized protein n=1 Tax=Schizothecium vesticola TaxID=314040 RepID=A0AA40F1T7_9PEZI|nr:hypothetical protein B0T18DRAFT_344130 [Schizothecium vesticola]
MDSNKINTHQQKDEPKGKLEQVKDSVTATFEHHKANPGPVIPKELNAPEEGTKEERLAKTADLNK